ncbi:hypothetical protein ACNOYE_26450 [Nannocystaceae bacterium ST9]
MRIRDEIRLGVGTLIFVQVLMMFAAVGLLARMTPAIDHILEDNERSIHAVERMLVVLAEPPTSEPARLADREQRFDQALEDALSNVTDERETPVLAAIEEQRAAGLAGDPAALAELRSELGMLGDINRDAMHDSNLRAKRLGTAGAWVLVLLGLIGLGLSIAVIRRFQAKLIRPVYELGAVLEACNEGDRHRRFNPADASSEFREVAQVVNALVGEHFGRIERDWEKVAKLDRSALLWLLDRRTEPTFVCGEGGAILASNHAGLDALRQHGGPELRDRIVRACKGEAVVGLKVEPLRDVGWVCTLG